MHGRLCLFVAAAGERERRRLRHFLPQVQPLIWRSSDKSVRLLASFGLGAHNLPLETGLRLRLACVACTCPFCISVNVGDEEV